VRCARGRAARHGGAAAADGGALRAAQRGSGVQGLGRRGLVLTRAAVAQPFTVVIKVGTSSLLRQDKNCIHLSQARGGTPIIPRLGSGVRRGVLTPAARR
jgi:hypothetical protein